MQFQVQRIRRLVNDWQSPGNHEVKWDGLDEAGMSTASGIYFYRLQMLSVYDPRFS